ncbi:hypothetical protein BMWSH_3393 [Priestia megaterium WSH-002]|uniref:Uncharacterized protein n=1 Tax=Priestia megaterium (strain WSH-002) TaxID=1006007 RepID=A0A8D3X240_PRIMW|nr:hypothetical protein BMWSH_3393 [Priestia megaterium WSH-002]
MFITLHSFFYSPFITRFFVFQEIIDSHILHVHGENTEVNV